MVSREELSPIGDLLVDCYLRTRDESLRWRFEYEQPPTNDLRGAMFRALVQKKVLDDPAMRLGQAYAEFGRVLIQRAGSPDLLLRAKSTVAIERALRNPGRLFDPNSYLESSTLIGAYEFNPEGLDLYVGDAHRLSDRKRLYVAGELEFVGTWQFLGDDPTPFGGDVADAFEELGDVDINRGEDLG
ncbi:MAG: hypothetical protein R2770_18025 [Acidimicrobiales bacterium]